eukprot:m.343471 g.343471  ORF g.343471 m.343471 type:complete len:343 (-) comp22867_c0_seq1:211-1239(-)
MPRPLEKLQAKFQGELLQSLTEDDEFISPFLRWREVFEKGELDKERKKEEKKKQNPSDHKILIKLLEKVSGKLANKILMQIMEAVAKISDLSSSKLKGIDKDLALLINCMGGIANTYRFSSWGPIHTRKISFLRRRFSFKAANAALSVLQGKAESTGAKFEEIAKDTAKITALCESVVDKVREHFVGKLQEVKEKSGEIVKFMPQNPMDPILTDLGEKVKEALIPLFEQMEIVIASRVGAFVDSVLAALRMFMLMSAQASDVLISLVALPQEAAFNEKSVQAVLDSYVDKINTAYTTAEEHIKSLVFGFFNVLIAMADHNEEDKDESSEEVSKKTKKLTTVI